MYVTYFDEVKANPNNGQHYYFVGGLCVPMDRIGPIEAKLNALAADVFGNVELTTETEFHASFIYFGKGPYKGMPPVSRIQLLGRLASVIAEEEDVKRVIAAINVPKLYDPLKAPSYAFTHFCERVQMAIQKGNPSLMIGDLDDAEAKNMIRHFAKYRADGRTPWEYGIEITSIVDTVHFARSHHSRMIQLADAYVFFASHRSGSRQGRMAEALTKELSDKDLYAHRYKYWPPAD
jgi:hypothetical protein